MLTRDSDLLTRYDRRISWSFGAIVLILMIIVSIVAVSLSSLLTQKQEDRLSGAIATILGESISRVSFSGKYHSRLFVEEMKSRVPDLVFISVETKDGLILAHSDPTRDDTLMTEPADKDLRRQSIQSGKMITQERIHGGMDVKEVVIPYRSDIGAEVIGVVRIGINFNEARKEQGIIILQLLILIAVLTTLAIWGIHILSHHFGRTVRTLAMQLQGILNHAPLAIAITDKAGHVPAFSVMYEDTFGRPAKNGTQHQLLEECLSESGIKELVEADRIVFESGMPKEREMAVDLHGKSHVWHISKFPIAKNEEGQGTLMCTFIHDITERKAAEEALRESEEKFRTLHQNMMDAFVSVDMEGRIIECNDSYLNMLGYPPEEISKLTYMDVTPEKWHVFEAAIVENQILANGYSDIYEKEYRRKDGTVVPVELRSTLMRDTNGSPIGMWAIVRDVTERKRVDEERAQSESRLRAFFEFYPDPTAITDPVTGQIIDTNEAFVSWSGYDRNELIGRSTADLGMWENTVDRDRMAQLIRDEGAVNDMEVLLRGRNGALYDILFSARFIDVGGDRYLLTRARDITERKRAQEALWTSESKLRSLFAAMRDVIIVLNAQGRYVEIAPTAADLLYLPPNQLLGKTLAEVLPEELADRFMESIHEVLNQGSRRSLDYLMEIAGQPIWFSASISPYTHDSVLWVASDITERKRAEEAVRESQRRLTDIIEFLPDATLVIDKGGMVIAWNRAMESMTGVKAEAMLGKGDYEYALPFYRERRPILIDIALRPDLEKETAYTTIQKTGDIVFGESYTPALSPGNVHLSATASVLRNSSGEIIGAIECIRNSTERKVMEERLQQAEKMESLGVLAGGVAHDMNNVLGVLVGYSELLLREIPEGSRAAKYAISILQGGERAAAIIQDLLTMARRGVSISEAVNLNLIVINSFKTPEFELLKTRHPEIMFRTQTKEDLLNIKGSPVHISKTIMNLLSNAAESINGAGEVTITTENRYVDLPIPGYENMPEGEYVVLTVSDTGSGISPADLGRIFEPFYTKKVMGRSGTGLGLAVVWGTMKDHSGYIDVRSEESKGSTFNLYFPATRESLPTGGQYMSPDTYSGQGETILVVDDIEEQRLLAATILENLNYRVSTAASGEDAVEYLRANKADLIVLDMIMEPGIDGLETYRRILEIHSKQKAIIVSGYALTDRVRAAQELGAGEYVKKPYVIEKLGIAVRKELDQK